MLRCSGIKAGCGGHPGRGGLKMGSLALTVDRDYMGSAGEEGVMSRRLS